ncbi:amino acid permease [Ilyonectria robusta]
MLLDPAMPAQQNDKVADQELDKEMLGSVTRGGAYHYERGESNTTDWSCSVPIVELIGLATGSDASAVLSCLILIIKNGTSALRSDIAMSRQGYAFSRDGGLFWNERLTRLSPKSHLPTWSINLPSVLVALIGLVSVSPSLIAWHLLIQSCSYLFSSAAFNAIIGSQAVCMIISFGSPALILLITRKKSLPVGGRYKYICLFF